MPKGRQTRKSSAARHNKAARRPMPAEPVAMPTSSAPTATVRAKSGTPQTTSSGGPKQVNLAAEYHYVVSDLKRLGILAVGAFGVLVVLALVLR